MRAEGFAPEAADPEFYMTLDTKTEKITLTWGVYDENFYCVSLQDGTNMLISRKEIASVYDLITAL